jgi:hypothetical protein
MGVYACAGETPAPTWAGMKTCFLPIVMLLSVVMLSEGNAALRVAFPWSKHPYNRRGSG